MSKIQILRRKPLLGRVQWRWRFISSNGRIRAESGESYSNRADLRDALIDLRAEFGQARVVTVAEDGTEYEYTL